MGTDDDTVLAGSGPSRDGDELGPGSRVGHYRIVERVAAGGFGTVFRVEHMVLGRVAALKVLHPALAGSREHVARFEREARAVNVIGHPNIVDVYEFGELPDGRPYFAMELLDGDSLDRILARQGPMAPADVVATLAPVCDALGAAHDAGIVHRDVKASNVVVAGDRVVLVDFGVAKLVDDPSTHLTRTGQRIGTPSSMAPEQIAGGDVTARSDVFGLGALAYHMLTGMRPFGDESATVMKYLHMHAAPPRVSAQVPVAPEVDAVVARAMAGDSAERYPGARELLAALRAAVEPATSTTTVRAIGVYVDIVADDAAVDDAALDDLDAVVPLVGRCLEPHGFRVAVDAGNAALLVAPVADEAARAAALAHVDAAWRAVLSRSTKDDRVRVAFAVHEDAVVLSGTRVRGALTRFATWLPRDLSGLWLSPALRGAL